VGAIAVEGFPLWLILGTIEVWLKAITGDKKAGMNNPHKH
jgi:hypothetical protein